MKTIGFWLLKKVFRGAVKMLREKVDTPEERHDLAVRIYEDARVREKAIGYLEKLLERADTTLDGWDGND